MAIENVVWFKLFEGGRYFPRICLTDFSAGINLAQNIEG